MEPEIQTLFDEAVKLFHEGDLRTALRFFRAYLTRSGRRPAEAYAYLKLIGDLALDAGRVSSGRGNLRQAADNFTLAMSAEGPATKVAAEHQKTVSAQLMPKLTEFKSAMPPPDPARPRLWRRPHMEFSHPLPLGPDTV